jgi:hypothetical protein
MSDDPEFSYGEESPIPPSRRWIAYAAIALLVALIVISMVF